MLIPFWQIANVAKATEHLVVLPRYFSMELGFRRGLYNDKVFTHISMLHTTRMKLKMQVGYFGAQCMRARRCL